MNITPQDLENEYRILCRALQEGRVEDAIEAVKLIPGRLALQNLELLSDSKKTDAVAAKRETIKESDQLAVFRQNGFNCIYCGRKTVLVPLLRVIAECFEQMKQKPLFSYHLHWKYSETHYAFWRDSASCDHIRPVASGGDSKIVNLVTACSMCNLRKGNSSGFKSFDGPARPWDGLAEVYLALVRERWPAKVPGYHKKWIKAIKGKCVTEMYENAGSGSL